MGLEAVGSVILVIVSLFAFQDAATPAVLRQESRPLKFVDLEYPSEARGARVHGYVVLELALDDQGRVISTRILSGVPMLADPAAANAKEWVFEPKSGTTALVYRFEIDPGLCNTDTQSFFRLRSHTLATVTACTAPGPPRATPWPSDEAPALVMPRLEYPQIAQTARVDGTVVIKVSIAGNGKVAAATPLAGPPLLASAALNNAKTWTFASTLTRETVIVYEFTFMDRLRTDPSCDARSLNEIVFPRFIRISAPAPCIQASTARSQVRASVP
jgi:TonB family protein